MPIRPLFIGLVAVLLATVLQVPAAGADSCVGSPASDPWGTVPLLSACLGADVAADSISTDAGDPFPAGPGVLPLLSRCAPFIDSELGRQFLDVVADIHIPPERPLLYSC